MFSHASSFTEKEALLKETLNILRNKNNVLCMSDVVWNHTACNSPWLAHHLEAGYNLDNSPHLKVAYELDEALIQMADKFLNGTLFSVGVNNLFLFNFVKDDSFVESLPCIKSDSDVQRVLKVFKSNVWPSLKLWQFFVVDVESTLQEFREALVASTVAVLSPSTEDILASISSTLDTLNPTKLLLPGSGKERDKVALEYLQSRGLYHTGFKRCELQFLFHQELEKDFRSRSRLTLL